MIGWILDEQHNFARWYQFPGSRATEVWSVLRDQVVAALNVRKSVGQTLADATALFKGVLQ